MVEYSAFNRLVPGSSPGRPNNLIVLLIIVFFLNYIQLNMNAISEVLRTKNSKCALIPFITAGYPNVETSIEVLYALDKKGADIIELGIPYSDALADGPVIQESSKIALEKGIYIDQVLDILKSVSPKLQAPIVIFTYYNPILARGIKKFIQEISYSGARGLIIPDLPVEETDYVIELCNTFDVELILFIAPTSSESRMASILSKSPGCLYLVSSCGVTGVRQQIESTIDDLASRIKQKTNKLIMLGFGISSADQASKISSWDIDGIVVGSAFIKTISSAPEDKIIDNLSEFCNEIKLAID
uniref:Tryptophan synthase alpha chain n=2 Tax=Grateloupia TaxID=31454 RepID=A0A2S1FX07_9FLOR|nr:tryptophan synthase alpha chain [Grateloupia filicina]AWD77307.1 tryptophan synthase alpha chain [Grateloupia filicina]